MRIFYLLLLLTACSEVKTGPYSIGRDQTWFPLNLGQRTANVTAFSTALIQEIAKEESVPLEIYNVSWNQLFASLNEKEYAGVLTSLPPNSENEDRFSFSDPFLYLGPVLVVRQNSDVHSLKEMEGKMIGTSQYDDSVILLQRDPKILIELYSNLATGLDDLASGRIDGLLLPTLEAHAVIPARFPGVLKIATPPLTDKALRLATLHGENENLISHFNKGLRKVQSKGRYQALREKFSIY
ncbi:MAG: L-cystine-binding protein FliY [Chlamydiales bacterium]|nr:L-cystine-binding protein FliY [Chlamydiales bacterium]MCH9635692.1 L-cystine-binding protein FliY [Chlamydiales bacterium]